MMITSSSLFYLLPHFPRSKTFKKNRRHGAQNGWTQTQKSHPASDCLSFQG